MNLMTIGSVHQYVKRQARQVEWNIKKRSGDLMSRGKTLADYVSIHKASDLLPQQDEQDTKLSSIITKAESGGKLTRDEWEYLEEKNPQLCAKLRQIEQEAEAHEEALKRCKTRDEALRLHVSKLGEILTAAKNGDSSALFRLNRMTHSMIRFTESEEYHDMPTEGEEAAERERERKAEIEALEREIAEAQEKRETQQTQSGEENAEKPADAGNEAAEAEEREDFIPDAPKKTDEGKADRAPADAERKTAPNMPEPHAPDSRKAAEEEPPAPPPLSPGHRAYLAQQSGESRQRRRSIDAEA